MDYKNKYNEALERAREMSKTITGANYEYIFPELKEDEDELTWLKNYISEEAYYLSMDIRDNEDRIKLQKLQKSLAWLEKQSEKKTAWNEDDERIRKALISILKSDFEKDTTIFGITVGQILAWLEKQSGEKDLNLAEILKHYPRETELYSPLYGKLWLAEVDEENEIITCYKFPLNKGCTRAILEQEKTISFYSNGTTGLPDCTISKDCMLFLYNKNQSEQKPVEWCEEDEEIVEALNDYTKNLDIFFSEIKIGDKDILSKEFREKVQHWLKILKGRVQPQSKQEWSEEDEKIMSTIMEEGDLKPSERNWLKTLKDRVQPQSKQEWGEEDYDYVMYI